METEENNKKNLKLSPKHFVLKAGRNMVDKIKNFGKQVAENYKNGFTKGLIIAFIERALLIYMKNSGLSYRYR